MLLSPDALQPLFYLVGEVVFYGLVLVLLASVLVAFLIGYSFYTDRFLFPNLMLVGIDLFEGVIKALFRAFRVDEDIVDEVGIELRNRINLNSFEEIPPENRAIFLPQCLRSMECPAKLSAEGIQCTGCGRCEIGDAKEAAEERGYQVFIVPGSSFIKRMIRKYEPGAIVGVGCLFEVKSGLEMCQRYGLPGYGLILTKSGCVATELEWSEFYRLIDGRLKENKFV